MPRTTASAILLLSVALSACGEDPQRAAARRDAHRDWCIAEELAVQANARLASMDTLMAAGNLFVERTLYPFTRAQYDFAKARERELALLDSAVAAGTREDSTGFARRAAEARPAAPTNEIQQRAAAQYTSDFALALGNPAHPCNLQREGER